MDLPSVPSALWGPPLATGVSGIKVYSSGDKRCLFYGLP